ncbi:hypothetical protein J6590_013451 [Homalodisca vitripennis]|nr:hypothetical protein J6590_013451 [Homalodisca vitripennis]
MKLGKAVRTTVPIIKITFKEDHIFTFPNGGSHRMTPTKTAVSYSRLADLTFVSRLPPLHSTSAGVWVPPNLNPRYATVPIIYRAGTRGSGSSEASDEPNRCCLSQMTTCPFCPAAPAVLYAPHAASLLIMAAIISKRDSPFTTDRMFR